MAIFTQGDKSCYFIHIPRTAGRYVSALFENSDGVESEYHTWDELFDGVHLPHLHYPLYNKICPDNITRITVVRNPYNKVLSSLKNMNNIYGYNYDSILCDEFECSKFIFQEIISNSFHNNWFLPQYKMISPKTHVWKYEWGFGKNFKRWIKKNTGIEINNKSNVNYGRILGETGNNDLSLSNQSQRNIKKFYHKDYIKFNYRRW